jgi:hypothetical protein
MHVSGKPSPGLRDEEERSAGVVTARHNMQQSAVAEIATCQAHDRGKSHIEGTLEAVLCSQNKCADEAEDDKDND